MSKNYVLRVDEEHEFELSKAQIDQLDIISPAPNTAHLLDQDQSYHISFLSKDPINRIYTVKVNGTVHKVSIASPLDQLIKEMGLSLGTNQPEDVVFAPMPGIILEVQVKEGDAVSQGDYLCVLEAMKMENALTAPRDGVIKSIHVAKGDTVDKGKLLIEFETDDK